MDAYLPLFSAGTLRATRLHDFPDIFKTNMDYENWRAAREQLWAIREGLA